MRTSRAAAFHRALSLSLFSERSWSDDAPAALFLSLKHTEVLILLLLLLLFDETRRKGTHIIIIFEGRQKKIISLPTYVVRTHSLKTSLSTSTKRMPTASNPNATRLPTTCIAGRRDTESPTAAANPIRARSKENISFFLSVCLSLSSANALSPLQIVTMNDDQYNTIRFKNSLSLFPLSLSLSPQKILSLSFFPFF